jgi:hypothetical protein
MDERKRWARVAYRGRVVFGTILGDSLAVHTGDLFDAPVPSDEIIALAEVTWLTPCDRGRKSG